MMNFNDKYKENHHNTNNLKDLKNKMSRDKCSIRLKNDVLKKSRDKYKGKFREEKKKVIKENELNNLKKQLEALISDAQRGTPIVKRQLEGESILAALPGSCDAMYSHWCFGRGIINSLFYFK